MINKELLELIHEAAHIQRWNDHIRPQGFTELDKQAHKMIIAYVLAKYEETDRAIKVNWRGLIEGGFFEFLHRIVLTDIKPPVFHELMKESGEKLNSWVLEQLEDNLAAVKGNFLNKFQRYLFDVNYCQTEKKILKAAHYLATSWEFKIIYHLNANIYGLEETKKQIENELEEYYDLAGVQKIGLGKKSYNFIDLIGKLRFQKRWAQSPRIPETSVMGHMLVVAMLSYLCSLEIDACERRICNNYFAGLFHDLPEVLTRDIISPVKRSVVGLEELIKEIETRQLKERILPLLPRSWHEDFLYYLEDEFKSKIFADKQVKLVSSEQISAAYNEDKYSPLDGELIKACDVFAAYIEAYLSISQGITSRHLQDGFAKSYERYRSKTIAGINFGALFNFFQLT